MKNIGPRPALLALFGVLLVAGGLSARARQETTIEVRPVAGAVSYLVGRGGNIGVSAGADGVLIVDDQFADLAPKVEATLAKLGGGKPRFVINTHHHGDHTGANAYFGESATILAHENVRARLAEEGSPAEALPLVTYAGGVSVHFNGEEIRVIHVPGAHTDGDSVVWFTGSNVVHLGDLGFMVGYPFVDVASGGDVQGLTRGLRTLLAELPADARFVPGHGDATDRAGIEAYLTMLETITARVKERRARGEDAAAMIAAGVTRDFDERWGRFEFVPPRRFVESVIASLE